MASNTRKPSGTNSDSKLNFRKAVVQLTQKHQKIDVADQFWEQFWLGHQTALEDVFALVTGKEKVEVESTSSF